MKAYGYEYFSVERRYIKQDAPPHRQYTQETFLQHHVIVFISQRDVQQCHRLRFFSLHVDVMQLRQTSLSCLFFFFFFFPFSFSLYIFSHTHIHTLTLILFFLQERISCEYLSVSAACSEYPL